MADKLYLSANELLLDSFRLGQMVFDSGWRPDVLIALWRGGTPVGVAVHELLLYRGVRTIHMALKCQSYTGIGRREPVLLENAEELCRPILSGHRVLVVDDIFDSGCTARAVVDLLRPRAAEVRLAMPYWKPAANRTPLRPDYHVRTTDAWIVFPHELEGLTPEEVRHKDEQLHELLFGRGVAAAVSAAAHAARDTRAATPGHPCSGGCVSRRRSDVPPPRGPGRPPRLPVVFQQYASPLYFVTCCIADRKAVLASETVHRAFQSFAERGFSEFHVAVGRYVLMPDHIHFFARMPPSMRLSDWVRQAKRALSIAWAPAQASWQRGFFDHLLRQGESYAEKWEYVRQNPVRAGLVSQPDDWPYQGEIVPLPY